VAIRTWLVRGGRAWLHTGGGIVADSEPAAEWQESLDKVGPLLAALEEVEAEGPAEPSASLLSGAPAR
jgi:anthranilate/para-aminobenzoate synthase component I